MRTVLCLLALILLLRLGCVGHSKLSYFKEVMASSQERQPLTHVCPDVSLGGVIKCVSRQINAHGEKYGRNNVCPVAKFMV